MSLPRGTMRGDRSDVTRLRVRRPSGADGVDVRRGLRASRQTGRTANRRDGWRVDRPHVAAALSRTGRRKCGRSHGDGRDAAVRGAARGDCRGRRSSGRGRSRVRSRGRDTWTTTTSSRSGFRSSACSRIDGWNTHQFHAATEFYSDYGVYDVRITHAARIRRGSHRLPSVGDGGAASDVQPHGRPGTTPPTETRLGTGTGPTDVHDFAWTASPHFIDREAHVRAYPGFRRSRCGCCSSPSTPGQEARHFDATAATLRYYGEWFGPYPYSHITIVDPAFQSGSGGMEYPMLFTAGSRWLAPARVPQPEAVTIHEAGHQFWYGIVGSNEFEHAWMDEGLNTFSTARAMDEARIPNRSGAPLLRRLRPVGDRRHSTVARNRREPALRLSRQRRGRRSGDTHVPYWPGTATFITYNKTALWLHTLERHLGWPVLQRIMSTYLRAMEVSPSAARGFLRGGERGQRARHDVVLRRGISQLECVRLRRADVHQHQGPAEAGHY